MCNYVVYLSSQLSKVSRHATELLGLNAQKLSCAGVKLGQSHATDFDQNTHNHSYITEAILSPDSERMLLA